MYEARKADGTPVQPGDRVIAFYDNGSHAAGTIASVNGPFIFQTFKGAKLQTYSIRGFDGRTRPAHAWNIKPLKRRNRK